MLVKSLELSAKLQLHQLWYLRQPGSFYAERFNIILFTGRYPSSRKTSENERKTMRRSLMRSAWFLFATKVYQYGRNFVKARHKLTR